MIQTLLSTEQLYYIKLIFPELSLKVAISLIKSNFSAISTLEEINIKSFNRSSSIQFLKSLFISLYRVETYFNNIASYYFIHIYFLIKRFVECFSK